ncbi:MAG: 3-deoxy-7-phosphoheptulonate synthase [Clostridia bacterium]|nr:3-deoxy-7-phosphoheptulonate synthase [Clostridia bacterium]
MIVIMKHGAAKQDIEAVAKAIMSQGLKADISSGEDHTVIGAVGDVSVLDMDKLSMMTGVDRVMKVSEPFKRANRKFHPQDTVVKVQGVEIGGKKLCVMAGPCSVESEEQLFGIARAVKTSGGLVLRGGAYKPRTSPYAFQGMEKEGLELLAQARQETGMPIVTEIIDPRHVEMFEMTVDILQIGARNMQNFQLLKEVGQTHKPVLLKRGLSNTIEEWLMSAEYILSRGNPNVILCERGIRTVETYTRNTLDLSAVVAVKSLCHLPVIVDPSHATGRSWMVEKLACAAIAAGADGLMIEVHNDPAHALCDGPQSLTPQGFDQLMQKARGFAALMDREL